MKPNAIPRKSSAEEERRRIIERSEQHGLPGQDGRLALRVRLKTIRELVDALEDEMDKPIYDHKEEAAFHELLRYAHLESFLAAVRKADLNEQAAKAKIDWNTYVCRDCGTSMTTGSAVKACGDCVLTEAVKK